MAENSRQFPRVLAFTSLCGYKKTITFEPQQDISLAFPQIERDFLHKRILIYQDFADKMIVGENADTKGERLIVVWRKGAQLEGKGSGQTIFLQDHLRVWAHPIPVHVKAAEDAQAEYIEIPKSTLDASSLDIQDLAMQASHYRMALLKVKKQNAVDNFWYPYDIMANLVSHMGVLLHGDNRRLLNLAKNQPIADIGAADGDLSFFLESIGVKEIDIIDHGPTNYNNLQGAKKLKQLLSSNVNIYDIDLNGAFELPRQNYGLIIFLGILYHLENPYYALKKLAQSTEYCLISTRIARYAMDRSIRYQKAPMAYLVDAQETNNDSTNYWIFSEEGLRRILKRTGWKVLEFMTVGSSESDPVNPQFDERAFCLVQSQVIQKTSQS